MDVATWLQALGLERHEADFRDNLIDMDVVCELNERSRKSRFGARRPQARPESDRPKKSPTAQPRGRVRGKLTAGDALSISCGALSEAERLSYLRG
jgi:SAM domain (Sterile alpha motif)